MRWIGAEEIRRALNFPTLVAALEAGHRRPRMEVQDGYLGNEQAQYFVRHAVDAGRFMASKLITSFPANLAQGKWPAVQAVVVLFDGRDGRPLAAMDGTEITYWRSAADSALGAKILALPDAETLLVVGAGGLARWLIEAHRSIRPSLRRVLIWNRTEERAAALAASLAQKGISAEATADLDAAAGSVDLVTTCTRSHTPLIKGAKLRPGMHLDLVGGYSATTREADDEAVHRARIFVDRRESALAVGDIRQPLEAGVIRESDVIADLYDLVGGSVRGRRAADEITMFKNAGGAHLDLMTAECVFRQLGTEFHADQRT
jgi:ornithine cyclodeaminase/alanine dehydrogenase-like protein (mu-crystallin family)